MEPMAKTQVLRFPYKIKGTSRAREAMPEIVYEIVEKIAVLSESSKGWTKELNLISWNDRDPKYDIREWSPDHEKMGKGVTLSNEEAAILKKALDSRDL